MQLRQLLITQKLNITEEMSVNNTFIPSIFAVCPISTSATEITEIWVPPSRKYNRKYETPGNLQK